jgi:hypothetical protein
MVGINLTGTQTQSTLGLGSTQTQPVGGIPPQSQGVNPFMTGVMGGAGIQNQYNAPLAPPSETEILSAMLNTMQPIDRFIISQNMPLFVEMIANITAFSLLNVLKNSTFKIDDDTISLDVASLPSDLQTLSAENIISKLNNMQNISQQTVTVAMQERDRIIALSQQSLMQGMLNSALADTTMLESVGSGVGSAVRSAFGFR